MSGGRRLDGDAEFGGDGCELSEFRHGCRRGGPQFAKHPVEATTRRAKDEHAGRLVADIAEGMAVLSRNRTDVDQAAARW